MDPHHTVGALKPIADNLQVNKRIVVAVELYFHTSNQEDVSKIIFWVLVILVDSKPRNVQ